jgi:phosphonate transport system substrate-binding protein
MNVISSKTIIRIFSIIIIFFLLLTCYIYFQIMDISTIQFPDKYTSQINADNKEKPTVFFGVISRYPPRKIYEGYQPIMDYLSQNSDYSFKLKLSNSYDETIQQLVDDEVQLAFLGTYIYYNAYQTHKLICILKPFNEQGLPFLYTTIIAQKNSDIKSIKDLSGKKLALSSRQSLTGNIIPFNLTKNGIIIHDLKKIQYFNHHTTVIQKVLKGEFDAGAVKNIIAEKHVNNGLKIIFKSEPFPAGPITVSNKCDTTIINIVKSLLLKIDIKNTEYQKLVSNWDSEFKYGFTEALPGDYSVIRSLIK